MAVFNPNGLPIEQAVADLAERCRHRLKFMESRYDKLLVVEMLELLEGPDGVPQVPHPDGTGDPAYATTRGTSVDNLSADLVVEWFARNDISLMPWQVIAFNRL